MEKGSSQHLYDEGKKEFSSTFLSEKSPLLEDKNEEERKALQVRLKREAGIIYDEALRYFADVAKQSGEGKVQVSSNNLQINLVQLPEVRAKEITERILDAERAYSADLTKEGYVGGTASESNELNITPGTEPILLTAEHATAQVRQGKIKEADWGTGGLTDVLATDHGSFAITPLGEQTGDANYDETHTLKEQAGLLIVQKNMRLALSIHGMSGGKFLTEPQKETGRTGDIAIGLGIKPTIESAEFAEWLQTVAGDLELRADINPWYLAVDDNNHIKEKDSLPLRNSFRAAKSYTTRSHYQAVADESGLILPIAQLELGSDLRVGPDTKKLNPEKIYKAYLLLTQAIEKFS